MIRERYQENLLPSGCRSSIFLPCLSNGYWRWRNILLFIIVLSILACLSIFLFLNMQAIEDNQMEADRFKPLSRRKPMLNHESIFADSGPSMIKLSDLLAHCVVALRIAGATVVDLSLAHNDKIQHVGSKGRTLEGVDDVITNADLKSHRMIINTIKDSYRKLKIVSEEDSTNDFEETTVIDDLLPINRVDFANLLRGDLHEIEKDHIAIDNPLLTQHETLVWIDPLDATKEYSENLTDYVTLMACIVHKSIPIAGVIFKPFTNQTYWSVRDPTSGRTHLSSDLKRLLSHSRNSQSLNANINIIVSRSHAGDVKNYINNVYDHGVNIISAGGSGYKAIELIRNEVDAYMHLTHIKKWDICAPSCILRSIPGGNMTDLFGNEIGFGDSKDVVVTHGLIATLDHKIHSRFVKSIRELPIQ